MNSDLKIIKKKYGENMMKLCREFFPTLLEKEGLLSKIMLEKFEPSHDLYDDIIANDLDIEFKNYIYTISEKSEENKVETDIKTPEELLSEAGYDLYVCNSEEEIQAFKKYYKENEKLCTFRGNRLDRCHVFFAVKKNVDEIKREDFDNPKRQDLYGTSVISIQFTKDELHTLSIKNRYNHTVNNPDATFSNNLDNIIPGLTESFEKHYGMVQKHKSDKFEIPNYVYVDGKYYKYNYEIRNIYYCPNNIIIDNFEVKRLEKEKYILLDYFVLDLQSKKIGLYDKTIEDSFIDGIQHIQTVEIENEEKGKKIVIKNIDSKDIIIKLDKDNQIIGYINENIKEVGKHFLLHNNALQKIALPEVKKIRDCFLLHNNTLQEISLPQVEKIKKFFLNQNRTLQEISLPQAKEIGEYSLNFAGNIKRFYIPNLDKKYYKNIPNSLQQEIVTQEQTGEKDEKIENRRNR